MIYLLLLAVTGTIMYRPIIPGVPKPLGQNIFSLLQGGLDFLVVVDQLNGLLAVLVPYARIAASFAHHFDHFETELGILFVGEADGAVEWGVFVEAGKGVAFEVLDVEEEVHCIVC